MEIYNHSDFIMDKKTAVTLGNFDGIHLGHLELINTVKEYARNRGLKSVMFSFYPHPVVFFGKNRGFKTMLTVEEKELAAEKTGVDILVQYPFTADFAALSPQEFMDILYEKTNCEVLVVGENYNFGKNRAGDLETLRTLGEERGIRVIGIASVKRNEIRVSSTRIRELISRGEMEEVATLLNKPYFVMGEVVHGMKRGRSMDFPTLNLEPREDKLLPPDGVYFSTTIYKDKVYPSMSNIGKNPTFSGDKRTIETHILNRDMGELYGENIVVCIYKKLRDEIKFSSMEELKARLREDKKIALDISKNSKLLKL